jgi:competence protein ComEC
MQRNWMRVAQAMWLLLPTPVAGQLAANEMRIHVIDVGQGSATLLEFSCGLAMVDAGAQDAAAVTRLVDYVNGVLNTRPDLPRQLDVVFITHNHVDHTRALPRLAAAVAIRRLVETGMYGSANDQGDAGVERVRDGAVPGATAPQHLDVNDFDVVQTEVGLTSDVIDPLACPGAIDPEIRILSADLSDNPGWPVKEFDNKTNHSLVLRIDFGARSLLITGDLEEPAIETMVDYYHGTELLDTDIYVVGHHGSANGTTTDLLKAIRRPELALMSMGPCTDQQMWTAWKYGHPRKVVVDRLVREVVGRRPDVVVPVATAVETFTTMTMKKAVYATGWDGTVVVTVNAGGSHSVTTSQASAPACG